VYAQQVLLASSVPNAVLYLYNPDETTTTAFNYLDYDTFYNRLFGLYLVSFISLIGQNVTVAGIKADWLVQNAAYKAANATDETPEEEEAAPVEEATPEEE
jgi:hypothetical protein